jgi:hypothetical protein
MDVKRESGKAREQKSKIATATTTTDDIER